MTSCRSNQARVLFSIVLFSALVLTAGCSQRKDAAAVNVGSSAAGLRPLTTEERSADFDAMVMGFRDFYAPLEYKEKRFGFKFDDLVKQYRAELAAAKTDNESLGIIKKFLSRFHDGHVSVKADVQQIMNYNVPLVIMPVENRVLVDKIMDPELTNQTGIEVGDEILEVDGQAPFDYLPTILKYDSMATPESDKHLLIRLLARPAYMTELVPTQSTVRLKIGKRDGSTMLRTLVWKVGKNPAYVDQKFITKDPWTSAYSETAGELVQMSLAEMGSETPVFLTPKAQEALKLVQVVPSEPFLKKHGITDLTKTPKLFAGLYRFNGKTILLARQATYSVEDPNERLAWYKAVLDEYGRLADVLVLDQTHNPGGSVAYAQNFVSLFANQSTANVVNFLHADRKWLALLGSISVKPELKGEVANVINLAYKLVESAYDKGQKLTEIPLSLGGFDYIKPADFTFNKPVLLLIDELAGSCGDIVPMLMRNNKLATTFGVRTMGLGGNVEPAVVMPNSQVTVRLTRGFFYTFSADGKYDFENPMENNGVPADIAYAHTVDDVRNGYVNYVTEFSKAAVGLVK